VCFKVILVLAGFLHDAYLVRVCAQAPPEFPIHLEMKGLEGWPQFLTRDRKIIVGRGWQEEKQTAILWDAVTGKQIYPTSMLDVENQKIVASIPELNRESNVPTYSPDGKVLAGLEGGRVRLFDPVTGRQREELKHALPIRCLALNPNGNVIATADLTNKTGPRPTELKLWDMAKGRELQSIKPDAAEIHSLAFSPDGKKLVVFADTALKVYDVAKLLIWKRPAGRAQLQGFTGEIKSLDFSRDSKLLVTASEGGVTQAWDVATGHGLFARCGLDWEPACLAFHEGKRPVRTASVSQVRQPIYQRSVARWKHYEPALGALFDRLGNGQRRINAFPA
jgi:WD40 repeat protein